MLRGLSSAVCRGPKLYAGRSLHITARICLNAIVNQDVQIPEEKPRAIFRTSESNPANHTEQHDCQHYSIPLEEVKVIFPHGLPRRFKEQIETFKEACLMVRKPALELFGYLKSTNFAQPAIRYVLYGERGTGKTMTLCHAVHYCAKQGWLVLHIPDAHLLVKNCKKLLQSSYKTERFDQPLQASAWLKNFKTSNEHLLREIKTQQKYMWNKWDSTEEGRPLVEMVEQGITRMKTATDVVGAVLKELKRQCSLGSFKLLVAVDGVNGLWGKTTLRKGDKSLISTEELALVHNLRKMVMNDWNGGAIVTTICQTGSVFKPRLAYLPHELLGDEGFSALEPFVPIQVAKYSEKEFESCYQYYLDRKWLQHEKARTPDGRAELLFLSGANPAQLERLAAML
ncbi:PREDICTED: 28S ribosomal protein S29, mitochondrial [Gavialis gangeticus]|uniref:28S ribosomal protein S29, mitochondrial n=1 Tax=Gavialis gangeticus TaxID=94835 RepID=UPI00092E709E|nr:PREDICTED: 28S ribosomal protein S29, mitochondrial [Gavialis gangeticus]